MPKNDIITIYPTVKKFILFHREKLYFESFRGEIKDLFTVGYAVLLNAEVRNDEVRVSYFLTARPTGYC